MRYVVRSVTVWQKEENDVYHYQIKAEDEDHPQNKITIQGEWDEVPDVKVGSNLSLVNY